MGTSSFLINPFSPILLVAPRLRPSETVPGAPFISPEAVIGMVVYTARAMLHGKGHDVWEMIVENIP